ncbi:MAG: hypothetical protein IKU44_04345 [Firmicutes bacterium]|nr:hypothetical protein [Bacillota bacterium]
MNKARIKWLRRLAIAVTSEHNEGGVCGFTPEFNFDTLKDEPRVHLTYDEFCETFDKCEKLEGSNELFVNYKGVKFFTIDLSDRQVDSDD